VRMGYCCCVCEGDTAVVCEGYTAVVCVMGILLLSVGGGLLLCGDERDGEILWKIRRQ